MQTCRGVTLEGYCSMSCQRERTRGGKMWECLCDSILRTESSHVILFTALSNFFPEWLKGWDICFFPRGTGFTWDKRQYHQHHQYHFLSSFLLPAPVLWWNISRGPGDCGMAFNTFLPPAGQMVKWWRRSGKGYKFCLAYSYPTRSLL